MVKLFRESISLVPDGDNILSLPAQIGGLKMKFKDSVDINAFLDATKQCSGEIFLQTNDGDILNLKSLLCRYMLMSIMGNSDLLQSAQITCVQEDDYQLLSEYLVPSDES